jgi:hypothetical protein
MHEYENLPLSKQLSFYVSWLLSCLVVKNNNNNSMGTWEHIKLGELPWHYIGCPVPCHATLSSEISPGQKGGVVLESTDRVPIFLIFKNKNSNDRYLDNTFLGIKGK